MCVSLCVCARAARGAELIKGLNGLGRDDTKNKKIADRIEKTKSRPECGLVKMALRVGDADDYLRLKRHHSIHPPNLDFVIIIKLYFLYSGYRWILCHDLFGLGSRLCPLVFARSRHLTWV